MRQKLRQGSWHSKKLQLISWIGHIEIKNNNFLKRIMFDHRKLIQPSRGLFLSPRFTRFSSSPRFLLSILISCAAIKRQEASLRDSLPWALFTITPCCCIVSCFHFKDITSFFSVGCFSKIFTFKLGLRQWKGLPVSLCIMFVRHLRSPCLQVRSAIKLVFAPMGFYLMWTTAVHFWE